MNSKPEMREPVGNAVEPTGLVGLMVVDGSQRLISANADAIQIVSYPPTQAPMPLRHPALAAKVAALLDNHMAADASGTAEFISGRRRYRCRKVALEPPPGSTLRPHTAILLERRPPPRLPSVVPSQYGLTNREQEIVELLMQGLTSKEIAQRKQLSPNTVKAFLRLVMVKMGVKSRAAIVGRLFAAVASQALGVLLWPSMSCVDWLPIDFDAVADLQTLSFLFPL